MTASSGYFRFFDRLGGTGNLGAVTGNDTFLLLTDTNTSYSYAAATTVTMQAITFTFQNISFNFDPDVIGSFTGNVFLADAYSGARLSANIAISAVPEPSTYALCGGIAALGLALWSRRRRVAG